MIYNLYAYQVPLSPLIGCLSPILPLLYTYSFAIQQPHYSKISNLDIMQETSSNSHRGSTIFGIILTILCKELARYIHHRPSHSPSFFDRKPYPSYLTCKLTVRYAKPTTSTLQQQFHPASHPWRLLKLIHSKLVMFRVELLIFQGFPMFFFHGPIMFLGQKNHRAEPRRSPAVAPPRPGATSPFWQNVGKPWENPWRTDGIPSGYLT